MKIQNEFVKIILLIALGIFNILSAGKVCAQSNFQEKLQQADSLYADQQYTESMRLYEDIYASGQASPAMLIKMAFIQEGLDNYSEALYYLNEYFLLTSEEQVLAKITDLSDKYELSGYEYGDGELIRAYLYRYQYLLIFILLGLMMLGMAYFIFRQPGGSGRPYGFGITFVLLLLSLFYLLNFSVLPRHAIITDTNAYIMQEPSAGAEVLQISDKGHRVKVNGRQDVWIEIEWEGEKAYVREDNLRILLH
jgi:uncharacterized protein YgiM (DUF1202 family)